MLGAEQWQDQNMAEGCVPKMSPDDAFEKLLNIMLEFDEIINDESAREILNQIPDVIE